MRFVWIIGGNDHLWAVKDSEKEYDELTELFNKWNNAKYLLDFFMANLDDLKTYFRIGEVSHAIQDTFEDADELEELIMEFRIPSIWMNCSGHWERQTLEAWSSRDRRPKTGAGTSMRAG